MKRFFLILFVLTSLLSSAQQPDFIYKDNIRTVKLIKAGDMYSYPIITLFGPDVLELHFDDLDGDVKNYYYTYQLCDVDWTPSTLFSSDYIRGFQSNRIYTYRNSSIAFTRYTHYQAFFPDRNIMPTRSGNYLLKVFLNDDTSKLVFTKRFVVVETKVSVAAQVVQPYGGQYFRTHQRVQVAVNTSKAKLNVFTPQDIKVVVLQNYVWPTSVLIDKPNIFRGDYYEYNGDELSFPAGKEWRWINLASIRLMSDRMRDIVKGPERTDVYVKPDVERAQQVYVYYRDNNGLFTMENMDGYNPFWQSDYAFTHFTFIPPGNRAYTGKDVHIFGELTGYNINDSTKMDFNVEKGQYEKTLLLKQRYYNYSYVTVPDKNLANRPTVLESTEGNYQGTENTYTVLVYYRPFGARSDELIGFAKANSLGGF